MKTFSETTPLISVIITTYNRYELLEETIKSVLNQTYQNIEIIVVDDASNFAPDALIEKINSSKIVYIKNPTNLGQPASRNIGIKTSKGEYIAFIDDDDLWLPEKLEKQKRKMDEIKVSFIYSDCYYFDHTTGKKLYRHSHWSRFRRGDVGKYLIGSDFIPSPTPLIRKNVFEKAGLFCEDRELSLGEDWYMWLRIAPFFHMDYCDEVLALCRKHDTAMTAIKHLERAVESHSKILNKCIDSFPDYYGKHKRKSFYLHYLRAYRSYMSLHDSNMSKRYLMECLRTDHFSIYNILILIMFVLPLDGIRTLKSSWLKSRCKDHGAILS